MSSQGVAPLGHRSRTAIRHDQVGGFFQEPPVGPHPLGGAQIPVDAAMHAALAPVAKEHAVIAVPVQQGSETAQVVPSRSGATAASSQFGQPPSPPSATGIREVPAEWRRISHTAVSSSGASNSR